MLLNRCTYLLPIRRSSFSATEASEFAEYFRALERAGREVLVIDGSPGPVLQQNEQAWGASCRDEQVDRSFGYLDDKVNGIHTGVNLASAEKILLADDDIRNTPSQIDLICQLLDDFEVVRPQNFLSPLPWWARMEAARMLINRAALRIAAEYFPWSVCFSAPLWIFERSLSTSWALSWHLARGGYPFGDKVLSKGIGRDWVSGGRVAAETAGRQPNE